MVCVGAHKAVLCSVSSVFHAMLSSELKERAEARIVIGDVCMATLQHLLGYAYSGAVSRTECVREMDLVALFVAVSRRLRRNIIQAQREKGFR